MKILKNHKIKMMAVLFLLSGLYTSCKKMIDIPPNPSTLPQTQVFADSADVMSAISGVYVYDIFLSQGIAYHSTQLQPTTGLTSDELLFTGTAPSSPDSPPLYNNAMTSQNSFALVPWTSFYTGLYQVNVCLEGVQGSTGISAALKQQLTGELEVIRAMYYLDLVNLYGGVPLVTVSNYLTTATLPRASVDNIYTQIMTDLTDAQTKLKAAYPSSGRARVNLYTADALLARVYLYRGQWQNAYNAANQVISSGVYSLVSDLNNVFLHGSNEAIWQIPVSTVHNETTQEAGAFIPGTSFFAPPTPNYSLNPYLMNAFEPNDQRWAKWVATKVATVGSVTQTYYYPYKYKVVTPPTNEDYMMMRYAEQYLIRAEAAAHLSNTAGAIADLNVLRARAGLGATMASSQADVLTAVMHERQIELFCEGDFRWLDLKRTGTIDAVLSVEKPSWRPYQALFPIPYSQTQLNPQLTQNPGYQ
jgi:hypothetical protein